MNRFLRSVCTIGLGASLAISGGCAAVVVGAAAGAGAYAYSAGKLKATVEAGLNETYDASRKACKTLELTELTAAKDAFGGTVEANTSDNTKVTITLKKLDDKRTEVGIRVGVFGDEHKSTAILAEIRKDAE